jgi:hypothetical protein
VSIVNPNSLADTLDALDEAFFFGTPITSQDKEQAARWIASRQGLPGSYANMFAPTDAERGNGFAMFTGDKISTRAGSTHIMGEEACRALILLDSPDPTVKQALANATDGMMGRLVTADGDIRQRYLGTYCCGTCSCAYWRHLSVGGLFEQEERLMAGLDELRNHRQDSGRWRKFPFYYALLALTEMPLPEAKLEIEHAAPACERVLKASPKPGKYDVRRRALAEKALGMV